MNWDNLNKEERAEYMRIQMAPRGGYDRSGYLPDDCGECGACGQPILGAGLCRHCFEEWRTLNFKLKGKEAQSSKSSM